MRIQFALYLTQLSLLFHTFIIFVLLPLLVAGLGFLLVKVWMPNLFLALLAGLVAGAWSLCCLEYWVLYPDIRNVQP
jgi:hypothetical protein